MSLWRSVSMNHVKVTNSSNVYSIGYDSSTQILEVRYLSGTEPGPLYRYENVPVVLHMQLSAAHSKGQYLSKHVKKNPAFKCTQVVEMPIDQIEKVVVEQFASRSEEKRVRTLRGDPKPLEPRSPKNVGYGVVDNERIKKND